MLTVLEGNNFLVADDNGDVGSGSEGLYCNDTRYLSSWRLLLNGETPQLLSSGTVDYYSAAVFMQNPATPAMPAGAVSLIRDVFVGEGGMQNSLHVENHLLEPVELELRIEFDFDFLDLFEVKAREYREEDLVFTARTSPAPGRARRDDDETRGLRRCETPPSGRRRWCGCPSAARPATLESPTEVELAPARDLGGAREHGAARPADNERRQRYPSFYFGQERVGSRSRCGSWQLHAPELATDWEEFANASTASRWPT